MTKTSVVVDSVGDATQQAPPYLDIVRVEIKRQGANFVFTEELAAPVPVNPPVPSGVDVLVWVIGLDTDSTTFPPGYPHAEGEAIEWEWFIEIRRYRPGFTDPLDPGRSAGILIDRRPLLAGRQATITPIAFSIEGSRITWVVDAAALGDPSSFKWAAGTATAQAGGNVTKGYQRIEIFDAAPDVPHGAQPATWSQSDQMARTARTLTAGAHSTLHAS